MSQRFQITRAAQLDSLDTFHWFITECCSKYNIPERVSSDLKLAIDEACGDIIEYSNKENKPCSINLSFCFESNQVVLQITDSHLDNPETQMTTPDSATLENRGSGMSGLYMVEQTMDNIDYQSTDHGNTLTITKYIN